MPSTDRVLKAAIPPVRSAPAPVASAILPGAAARAPRLIVSDGLVSRAASPGAGRGWARPDAGPAELPAEIRRAVQAVEARGYEDGRVQAQEELAAATAAAGALAAALDEAAPRDAAALAALVAELSIAVARRILVDRVTTDPASLATILERAMDGLNGSPEVRVLLHPTTVDAVRDAWVAAHGTAHLGKRWSFEPDPGLPVGGCVVRHEHGFVDAGLEAQLAEISGALAKVAPLVGHVSREVAT